MKDAEVGNATRPACAACLVGPQCGVALLVFAISVGFNHSIMIMVVERQEVPGANSISNLVDSDNNDLLDFLGEEKIFMSREL